MSVFCTMYLASFSFWPLQIEVAADDISCNGSRENKHSNIIFQVDDVILPLVESKYWEHYGNKLKHTFEVNYRPKLVLKSLYLSNNVMLNF